MLLHLLYMVFHKSVKHFKNSQQIDYAKDHGNSYADRERNSPSFFLHISQMLNVSTIGNTADICAIVRLVPHTCQHITVDQSHSSGDTAAKILEISGEWRHKDNVLHKPPEKSKRILSIFRDESTGSCICPRSLIYMLHILLLCESLLRVSVVLY
jgi:hypothetical protein